MRGDATCCLTWKRTGFNPVLANLSVYGDLQNIEDAGNDDQHKGEDEGDDADVERFAQPLRFFTVRCGGKLLLDEHAQKDNNTDCGK